MIPDEFKVRVPEVAPLNLSVKLSIDDRTMVFLTVLTLAGLVYGVKRLRK